MTRLLLVLLLMLTPLIGGCLTDSDGSDPTAASPMSTASPTVEKAARADATATTAGTTPMMTLNAHASADTTGSRLWAADGTLVAELGESEGVTALAWSPDGRELTVGGADGKLRFWNADGSPGIIITVSDATPPQPVAALDWSSGGKVLAAASVQPPDAATPGPVNTLPASVQTWQRHGTPVTTREIEHTFRGIVHLAWSADGERLLAGGNDLYVWDLAGTELLAIPGGEFDVVSAVAFAPDGQTLAFVDGTNNLVIYSVAGGAPSILPGFGGVAALAFSPDAAWLAISTDSALRLLDASNPFGEPVSLVANGVEGPPVWAPGSSRIATGTPGRAVLVFSPNGQSLATLTGCEGFARSLVWSPNGASIAAGFEDGRVCIWDAH